MYVIKRDGRKVKFDAEKIYNAIISAFKSVDDLATINDEDDKLVNKITEHISEELLKKNEDISVEEIQDIVEKSLMSSDRQDVAKAYIIYRNERSRIRSLNTSMMRDILDKLYAKDVKRQNANVDEKSFGGRSGEAADVMLKRIALDSGVMSEKAVYNHVNNIIYTHDLASFVVGSSNCMAIPFDKLLKNGFTTRQTSIRGVKSVSSAFQILAVIFQLQSLQQYGGVSATHLDWTMVPYVRMSFYKHWKKGFELYSNIIYERDETDNAVDHYQLDPTTPIDDNKYKVIKVVYDYAMNRTKEELDQSVEAMYHNLNSLQSRSGNQLPFTSVNYGTCTLPEGRMVIKAVLEGSINGTGFLYETSIFPCGIFQYMKGVNDKPGTPNYDLKLLALKSTAKRLYPNYANIEWSGNAGFDRNNPDTYFNTMGCRTAIGYDINGLGYLKEGRGNICPVTIILPTIGMMAKEVSEKNGTDIVEEFMTILDEKIHDAKDQLIERFEWVCAQPPESASFMYDNNIMAGYVPEEGIRSALKHGTLGVGQLGLAETLHILIGCNHTTEKGMQLAKRIEGLFKQRANEFKEEYKLNFGVYFTPAENLCYTAMKKFQDKYGKIENVSENEYFTNSMHVPVWEDVDPFEKIDIESELTGYSSAGCITYVELDSTVVDNMEALETLIDYAMNKDIPYLAINIPNDTCTKCGYTGDIEEDLCPKCGHDKIKRLKRVTGYLTGDYKKAFNKGKQNEAEMRVRHSQKSI